MNMQIGRLVSLITRLPFCLNLVMSAEQKALLFNEVLVHEYLIRDKMNAKQLSMGFVIRSVDTDLVYRC
jgi:hypothetical protein